RNILLEKIEQVPAGGSIDWVTYYFRDRELARALIKARQRGVAITLTLSAKPRTAIANEAVIKLLQAEDGLGNGLTLINIPGIPAPRGRAWRPQLHEKLYCFSHPEPIAYIGSFNPSGDTPEQQPDIIKEVGDHNTGHNLLLGITDQTLVQHLQTHARHLHDNPPGLLYRFSRTATNDIQSGDTHLYFWPRRAEHPILVLLEKVTRGARVSIAASHIRSGLAVKRICKLAGRGVTVDIIAEASRRRVTPAVEQTLLAAGVNFRRLCYTQPVPMHLKFMLVQTDSQCWSVTGSYNWTLPSFLLNHEIALITENRQLFQELQQRWQLLQADLEHIID
ncbi:MAG: phospholipase D-like domain-containing protein, partial [Gammaproteobacteria bacterium]